MNKFWKSALGASCLMVQPLLLNLLSLPATAYIIAVLGPHDYGQWAVALTLNTTVMILTNAGLRSLFIRTVAQNPGIAPEAAAEQLGARMIMAVAAGAASVSLAYLLGYPTLVVRCAAILAIGLVFGTVAATVADLLQAREELPALATINLVAGLLLTAASVAAMWFGAGPLALAWCYVLGPASAGLLSVVLVHRRIFPVAVRWSPRRHYELLKQAKMLGLQQLILTVGNQAENLLVPKLVGLSAFGQFAAGTLLPRRMEVVPDALTSAFYPLMAKAHRRSADETRAVIKRFTALLLGLCIPAAGILFLLAGPISRILFPEDPHLCRTVLQITVWWVPLLGIANGMGYALNAAGREATEVRLSIASTVTALAVSTVFILQWGLIGACFALIARGVLGIVIRLPFFIRSEAWRAPQVVGVRVGAQ